MKKLNNKTVPLLCWDICQMDLLNIGNRPIYHEDISILRDFGRRFGWSIELNSVLSNPYEALVLTDNHQIIRWANKGFQEMTGYPLSYSIGKNPRFLQGEFPSAEASTRIRSKIQQRVEFSDTVINYRSNGEKYICRVHIFPIENQDQRLTHYLALEQEVR